MESGGTIPILMSAIVGDTHARVSRKSVRGCPEDVRENTLHWFLMVIVWGMLLVTLVLLIQVLIAKLVGRNNKKSKHWND